jgi:nucleoside 2-deoxyribosyltransferase
VNLKEKPLKLCISSSCRFEKDWQALKDICRAAGVEVTSPDVRDLTGKTEEEIKALLGRINRDYYKEIDECDILYVWCPGGYIGKGVAAEIGYALAKGKKVVSSHIIEDGGIRALVQEAQ